MHSTIKGTEYFNSDPQFKAVVSSLQQIGDCCRCGATFIARENIGTWKCCFHPGPFNDYSNGTYYEQGAYECCGRRPLHPDGRDPGAGCVKADHSINSTWNEGNHGISVWDKRILTMIQPPRREALQKGNTLVDTPGPGKETVVIYRYDIKGIAANRINKGFATYIDKQMTQPRKKDLPTILEEIDEAEMSEQDPDTLSKHGTKRKRRTKKSTLTNYTSHYVRALTNSGKSLD